MTEQSPYAARRARLAAQLGPDAVALVPTAPQPHVHSNVLASPLEGEILSRLQDSLTPQALSTPRLAPS